MKAPTCTLDSPFNHFFHRYLNTFKEGQKPTVISFPREKWTVTLEVTEGELDHVIPKGSFDLKELDPLLDVEDVVFSGTSYSRSIQSMQKTLESISDLDLRNGLKVLQSAKSDLATASPFEKALVSGLLIPFKLLDAESEFRKELQASTKAMLSASRCIVNVGKHSKITSAKGQFRSVSKLLRDVALFIEIYEIKRNSGQSVGGQFSARLAKYDAELDDAKRDLIFATTDDDKDISKHLVIGERINVQFKDGTESTSLELFFNGDLIPTKNSARHEWTLPCDIPMLPGWDDTITIQDSSNLRGAITRMVGKDERRRTSLDYKTIADRFRAQRNESKAKGELRAHETLLFSAELFTVTLKVSEGSITHFLSIGRSPSNTLLPESATEAITWVHSKLENAQKLESVMENIPITEDILQVLESTFDTLANAHPLAKAVWTLLSIPYNLMKSEQAFKNNVKDLIDAMVTSCKCLTDSRYHVKITSAKELFASIMKTLRNVVLFVGIYLGKGRFGQFVGAQFPKKLKQYVETLVKQKNDFQMAVILQIARDVDGLSSMTHDDFLRRRLHPVDDEPLGEGCLENTRVKILKGVMDWIHDCKSENNILWIVGAPGAGKSTIATTIAKKLAEQSPFCAEFFCKRDNPYLRDPRQIWRALAYGLAGKHDSIKAALMRTLDQKKGNPRDDSALEQFHLLIEGPLQRVLEEATFQSNKTSYPIVIIDAVDECFSANDTNSEDFLESLRCWARLRGVFKLIVTSRDLTDIRLALGAVAHRVDLSTGNNVSDDSKNDIKMFFVDKFTSIRRKQPSLRERSTWPDEAVLGKLVEYAAGLFVWADMVVKFVGFRTISSNPDQRLKDVLDDTRVQHMNQQTTGLAASAPTERNRVDLLYARILFEAFRYSRRDERTSAMRTLATIVLSKRPLRKSELVELLSSDTSSPVYTSKASIESTLEELSPIVPVSDSNGEVRVCHKTVSDFLLSRKRSTAAMTSVLKIRDRQETDLDTPTSASDIILNCETESGSIAVACLRLICLRLTSHAESFVDLLRQQSGPFYYARQHWIGHLNDTDIESVSLHQSFARLAKVVEIAYQCLERYSDRLTFAKEQVGALIKYLREAADFASQCINLGNSATKNHREVLDDYADHVDIARGHIQIAMVLHLTQSAEILASNPSDYFLRRRLQPSSRKVLDDPVLNGTRTSILRRAKEWVEETSQPNILWIVGAPGAGKSAIATTLARELSRGKFRVCATVFAKRDYVDRRDPTRVWRTLAYDLASLHIALKGSLMESLLEETHNPGIAADDQLRFRRCVVKALQEQPSLSVVCIIDALDECFTENNEDWKALLATVAGWADLPRSLKLLVTSRDIPDIRRALASASSHVDLQSKDEEFRNEVKSDIRLTFQTKFAEMQKVPEDIREYWLQPDVIRQLTEFATGSFIWVKMVIEFVKLKPHSHLEDLLNNSKVGNSKNVDALYAKVLYGVLGQLHEKERNAFRSALAVIVFAKTPLRETELIELLSVIVAPVDETRQLVVSAIKEFSSILAMDEDRRVRIPHKSFVDFLSESGRSIKAMKPLLPKHQDPRSFLINREEDTPRITLACLQLMNNSMKLNVCGIQTSHYLNNDIPEPAKRLSENVSSALIYARRFWMEHLKDGKAKEKQFRALVKPMLKTLLCENLLYWLETCSLLKDIPSAKRALEITGEFLKGHDRELVEVAKDACLFINMFEVPITAAATHIYLSALPFCPSESWIARIYGPRYPSVLSVVKGRRMNWNTAVLSDDAHESAVYAVAVFPGGGKIASGSSDKTVRVWDAETGHALTAPSTGHDGGVWCVAISPDERQIASGDRNGALRIWDSDTDACPLGSIKAHSDLIRSVAFSPNGSRIVTGSNDRTVQIWDVATGDLCLGPLTGHTSGVRSVAYSIDGAVIASGSNDATIRIWDTRTGEPYREPLTGHTDLVRCVAFSPDGCYLASGSGGSDNTINLWDIAQGFSQTSATPVKGGCVTLSFSPDSNTLVSVSGDNINALYFWNVRRGKLEQIGAPIYGHADTVSSVAFAPDGLSVASCSDDNSIKIWTVPSPSTPNSPPASAESLDAHGNPVLSDEFFIDGDGWMRTSRRDGANVLFWVPEENRECFWRPRNTAVIHRNVTKLDFRRFVHGEHWADCCRSFGNSEGI